MASVPSGGDGSWSKRALRELAAWLLLVGGVAVAIVKALSGHLGTPQLPLLGGLPIALAVAGLVAVACPIWAAAIVTQPDTPSPRAVPVVVVAMTIYGASFASELLRLTRLIAVDRVVVFDSGYLEFFGGVAVLGIDLVTLALVAIAGLYVSRVMLPRARRHSARHLVSGG